MKNTLIRTVIYFFLIIFLPACGNNGAKNGGLLYWSSNNPYEIQFAQALVKEWNQLHPDSQIIYQPVPEGRSSEEIILAAVVGKTTPAIYSNMWQGDVEAYAQAGVLVPLDTIPGFLKFLSGRCDSSVINEIRSDDGHIYQIPWKINPIMHLYNKNRMQEIGYPNSVATYSEFLDAAAKFQKDSDGDGYVDRWLGYSEVMVTWYQRFFDFYPLYLAASGGAPLVKNNQVMFNNTYAVEVFRFLQKVYQNNYFPKERLSARSDAFLGEIIATRFTGPWEITHAEKFKPEGFEYDFHPIPVPDDFQGHPYTYGDPKNIVLFNTCSDPILAWRFIQTLIDLDGDLKFLQTTSQLPRRKDLYAVPEFSSFFAENPKMLPFAKQADFVRGTDICPVLKEVFDVISQEYEACVIYGVKSPEAAVESAAKAAQLLLK